MAPPSQTMNFAPVPYYDANKNLQYTQGPYTPQVQTQPKPTAVSEMILHPIKTFEKDVKKDIEKPVDTIIDVGKSAVHSIENGFGYVKQGFENFENTVSTDFKIVEQDAKIALDYGERIGKDLFNLMKLAGRSAEWLIENNKVVLAVGALYVGARIFNEVKQVV